MKNRLSYIKLSTVLFLAFFVLSVEAFAQQRDAQTASSNTTSQDSSTESHRTSADETFDLNILERRITRQNFEASTSVDTGANGGGERGLRLRVGVAVGAEEINALLRNVRGRVRFRATLERVLERINLRRTNNSTP